MLIVVEIYTLECLHSRVPVFSNIRVLRYLDSRVHKFSGSRVCEYSSVLEHWSTNCQFFENIQYIFDSSNPLFFEIFFEFLFLFISPRSNCLNFFILSLITLEDIQISEYPKFPRFNRRKKVCIFA